MLFNEGTDDFFVVFHGAREADCFTSQPLDMGAAYFHERRSLNNFHRDQVITFEQIAE